MKPNPPTVTRSIGGEVDGIPALDLVAIELEYPEDRFISTFLADREP